MLSRANKLEINLNVCKLTTLYKSGVILVVVGTFVLLNMFLC